MYLAESQSILGDQIARVAIAALIYRETESAAQTALAYALTFLPAILGGALLSGLADRIPRRTVMVVADLSRAALLPLLAVPSMHIGAVYALLVLVGLLGPLFSAAEVSLISVVLDREPFRVASGLRMATGQAAQVVGFALGGLLAATAGPAWALLIDATTFAVSAVVTFVGLSAVPAARTVAHAVRRQKHTLGGTLRMMWGNRQVRWLVCLSSLAAFFIAPEGLAVPYSHSIDASRLGPGALMAAIPLGSVVGAYVLVRRVPPGRRLKNATWMAVLAGVPLMLGFSGPPLGVSALLWAVSGFFSAYQVEAMTAIVQGVDEAWRPRVLGVVAANLTAVQGVGLILFGVVANILSPAAAIAVAGGVGTLGALALIANRAALGEPGGNGATRSRDVFTS